MMNATELNSENLKCELERKANGNMFALTKHQNFSVCNITAVM